MTLKARAGLYIATPTPARIDFFSLWDGDGGCRESEAFLSAPLGRSKVHSQGLSVLPPWSQDTSFALCLLFSACVIAKSISKNWTCNLRYQKGSKLKAEMRYLLSLLRRDAKEHTPTKPVSYLNS